MQILTVNISQTATNKANIATAKKWKVAHGHSIGLFAFDLDPISRMVTQWANIIIAIKYTMLHKDFRLAYLYLILAHSKFKVCVMHNSTEYISKMFTDRANITCIAIKYDGNSNSWLSISIFRVRRWLRHKRGYTNAFLLNLAYSKSQLDPLNGV